MYKVLLTGWKLELRKVSLNHLLREQAGLKLGEAKSSVDALLQNKTIIVEFPSREQAESFLSDVQVLGAVGKVENYLA